MNGLNRAACVLCSDTSRYAFCCPHLGRVPASVRSSGQSQHWLAGVNNSQLGSDAVLSSSIRVWRLQYSPLHQLPVHVRFICWLRCVPTHIALLTRGAHARVSGGILDAGSTTGTASIRRCLLKRQVDDARHAALEGFNERCRVRLAVLCKQRTASCGRMVAQYCKVLKQASAASIEPTHATRRHALLEGWEQLVPPARRLCLTQVGAVTAGAVFELPLCRAAILRVCGMASSCCRPLCSSC